MDDALGAVNRQITKAFHKYDIHRADQGLYTPPKLLNQHLDERIELTYLTCKVLQIFKQFYLPHFIPHWWCLQKYLYRYKYVKDCEAACVMVSDLIEHCGEDSKVYYEPIIPLIMDFIQVKELKHITTYIFGLIVEKNYKIFNQYKDKIIDDLIKVASEERSSSRAHNAEIDNAILGLGKLIINHYDTIDVNKIMSIWLSNMPAQADEKKNTLAQFLYFFKEHTPKPIIQALAAQDFTQIQRIIREMGVVIEETKGDIPQFEKLVKKILRKYQ